MRKTALLAGLLAMVSAVALGAEGGKRIGLGVSTSMVDGRLVLDGKSAADAFVSFDVMDTKGGNANNFGIGGYYLRTIFETKPVTLHWLAGISLEVVGAGGYDASTFSMFGGIGAEYFLPGTENFSLEANMGVNLGIGGGDNDTTTFSTANLTGGIIMLRYYFN